eukprot:gnl/TRDRNA2_/TRDRNA2_177496_c0_seq17.p1 gnl/TRDRNA2_/TRDRNA2_177496_c0~~gnl/TRDRNA2_/TRDRNA2_177496_c0_seq17.p1  ORF type:complete len:309 (-),score=44.06 gnl/TRDRNA2_/TRDRNA2_177496_c0_seq17:133-1059(-)
MPEATLKMLQIKNTFLTVVDDELGSPHLSAASRSRSADSSLKGLPRSSLEPIRPRGAVGEFWVEDGQNSSSSTRLSRSTPDSQSHDELSEGRDEAPFPVQVEGRAYSPGWGHPGLEAFSSSVPWVPSNGLVGAQPELDTDEHKFNDEVEERLRLLHENLGIPVKDLRNLQTQQLLEQIPLNEDGELTSVGSIKHDRGQCRPCAYWFRSVCAHSILCRHCHLTHDGRKSGKGLRPSKQSRQRMRARQMNMRAAQGEATGGEAESEDDDDRVASGVPQQDMCDLSSARWDDRTSALEFLQSLPPGTKLRL